MWLLLLINVSIFTGALYVLQQDEEFPAVTTKGNIISLKQSGNIKRMTPAEYGLQLRKQTVLLLIEPQVDFHNKSGSCPVAGAEMDTDAYAELIRDHVQDIDDIVIVLDSHQVRQLVSIQLYFVFSFLLTENAYCPFIVLGGRRWFWSWPASRHHHLRNRCG